MPCVYTDRKKALNNSTETTEVVIKEQIFKTWLKRRAKQYVQKLVGAKTELKQKTKPKKLMRSVERRSVEIAKEKCRD